MRAKVSIVRKTIAFLVAAAFVLVTQPAALAMPAPQSASMHMTSISSHGMTGCDHAMPKQDRSTPCKDMANCLGMMNCVALTAIPQNAVAVLPLSLTALPSWQVHEVGPGITLQPDNPPPIA